MKAFLFSVPFIFVICYLGIAAGNNSKVHVYVLDNGVRPDHVAFKSVVGDIFVTTERGGKHGSHATTIGGIIAGNREGIARGKVVLHSVKILDRFGDGKWENLLRGLHWVLAHHEKGTPAIVNLSLGGTPESFIARYIEKGICDLVAEGIVVVVAAGNEGIDQKDRIPSRMEEVISVGAVTRDFKKLDASNKGSCVDLYTIGENILGPSSKRRSSWTRETGTSFAAAVVSGVVANYFFENPDALPSEVKRYLLNICQKDRIKNLPMGEGNLLLDIQLP